MQKLNKKLLRQKLESLEKTLSKKELSRISIMKRFKRIKKQLDSLIKLSESLNKERSC